MSSMKLFNKDYLFQNIKKSIGPLSIFVCIIPILNFIYLLFRGLSSPNGYVFSLEELSAFNYIGIYILPLILSICLFGYVFKKKSVDFVNSMPISRATIFFTNSIGGILILISMLLVNSILTFIISLCFSNIIVPLNLLFDYLIFWSISYIFVFMVSNVAVSLSGNAITSIVVTALLLFLIPFCTDIISSTDNAFQNNDSYIKCASNECIPEDYSCHDNSKCNLYKNINTYKFTGYERHVLTNYTTPYSLIHLTLFGTFTSLFSKTSLVKMIILSILYFFIGVYIFSRRKMENCELSFKNFHVHSIVKCLTMVPMVVFVFFALTFNGLSSLLVLLLFLALLITYYFVYDLVTKRGIKRIGLSLLYFVISFSLIYGLCALEQFIVNNYDKNTILSSSKIDKVVIENNTYDFMYKEITSTNKDFINETLKLMLNNSINDEEEDIVQISVSFYIDKVYYSKTAGVSEKVYNELINKYYSNDYFEKEIKKVLSTDKVAIGLNGYLYKPDSKIKRILSDISKQDDILKKEGTSTCSIEIYEYKNNKYKKYKLPCDMSNDLSNYILNKRASMIKKIIVDREVIDIYLNGPVSDDISIKFNYIGSEIQNKLVDFILNDLSNKFDENKDFYVFSIYHTGGYYDYYTNNVSEVDNIINSSIDVNSDEYKDYINEMVDEEYE